MSEQKILLRSALFSFTLLSTDFWKCWQSKFGSSNNCQQVEGCVDNEIIADKFCCYFMNTYNANNASRANELENAYFSMREKYCGLPSPDFGR